MKFCRYVWYISCNVGPTISGPISVQLLRVFSFTDEELDALLRCR